MIQQTGAGSGPGAELEEGTVSLISRFRVASSLLHTDMEAPVADFLFCGRVCEGGNITAWLPVGLVVGAVLSVCIFSHTKQLGYASDRPQYLCAAAQPWAPAFASWASEFPQVVCRVPSSPGILGADRLTEVPLQDPETLASCLIWCQLFKY